MYNAGSYGQNTLGHSKSVFDSRERSCNQMSTNKSNHLVNPQAREAMDRFKMEAASQVGVNLTNGYNGELTSRQAGSIGGQMVKKMIPIRTAKFIRADRTSVGHVVEIRYIASFTL